MSQPAYLLEKALNNIEAAELLAVEGYDDIAVSRAYYAMFYLAEALLFSKGQAYSSHSAVIAAFGKEYAKTQLIDPKFHSYLLDAFEARQMSDYAIELNISKERVDRYIGRAKEFLDETKAYFGHTGN